MPVRVIAIPADRPGLAGGGLDTIRARLVAAAPSRGHEPIGGYTSVDALFDAIESILDAKQDCLEILEITAHGDATLCDGIGITDATGADERRGVETIAKRLTALSLCDHTDVYLSACNTGLPGLSAAAGARSIAERLADALPRFSPTYQQRITIHGTRGYFGGTHMGGNAKTDRVVWGSLEARAADYPPFDDAMVASGSGCWRPFRNGW